MSVLKLFNSYFEKVCWLNYFFKSFWMSYHELKNNLMSRANFRFYPQLKKLHNFKLNLISYDFNEKKI